MSSRRVAGSDFPGFGRHFFVWIRRKVEEGGSRARDVGMISVGSRAGALSPPLDRLTDLKSA
jgi:hypothetical protein